MNIIITGAGKGIGLELARLFANDHGNEIFAISRDIRRLNDLKEKAQKGTLAFSRLHPFAFDLVKGDYSDLKAFVDLHTDHIDLLVNNAGFLVRKPVEEFSDDDFDAVFDTNVKAVFRMVRVFMPLMKAGSHILNISSMGGFQGSSKFAGLSIYSASKGALSILTECLAEELKERNIKVNCLALGSANTEMLAAAFPGYRAPLSATEMAGYIRDFAMTGHKYFNGKIIPVSLTTP